MARDGGRVRYEVTSEEGPPHDRSFEVGVSVDGEQVGAGGGRSKKAAEQAAAAEALERFGRIVRPTTPRAFPFENARMHLSSISIKGFKSFPERTRLEFSPGVSVIVGPNGCGKSNITDAVLWALGEQSPLSVRGQSMQDMVYTGGEGVGPSRYAEVEVVLAADTEDESRSGSRRSRCNGASTGPGRASTG